MKEAGGLQAAPMGQDLNLQNRNSQKRKENFGKSELQTANGGAEVELQTEGRGEIELRIEGDE